MKIVGNNPIIPHDGVCDPHIHIFGGKAYLYSTHDDGPGHDIYTMYDWRVFSSDDLVHWTLESTLCPEDTYIGATSECYATDAAERDGKYYFYFSHQQYSTGVAVGDAPGGPFRDALGRALLPKGLADTASYDPTVFVDDDPQRTPYIVFGYQWVGKRYYIARLNEDMISLAETPRPITIEGDWVGSDASWITKRGGVYYLNSHEAAYALSDSIYGPYVSRKPFYKDAHADHGTFFDFHNQNYFAYGVPENWGAEQVDPFYRTTKIAYAGWKQNGDIVVDPASCRVGVGQYDAAWGVIPASWYFSATDGLHKEEDGDRFVVTGGREGEKLTYPNWRGIPERPTLTLCACCAKADGEIEILADGVSAGRCHVPCSAEFVPVQVVLPLSAGTHEIALTFHGEQISVASLALQS